MNKMNKMNNPLACSLNIFSMLDASCTFFACVSYFSIFIDSLNDDHTYIFIGMIEWVTITRGWAIILVLGERLFRSVTFAG